MKNGRLIAFAFLIGLLGASAPLMAHHGQGAYGGKSITLNGTVAKFEWTNPHCILDRGGEERPGRYGRLVCGVPAAEPDVAERLDQRRHQARGSRSPWSDVLARRASTSCGFNMW